MGTASLHPESRMASLVCCGIAVLPAAVSMFSWINTGHASDLLFALAGIAIGRFGIRAHCHSRCPFAKH
jgi:hypothetical protein